MKWGMQFLIPSNVHLISIHPTNWYMGYYDRTRNKNPLHKDQYGYMFICYVSARLSNNKKINGSLELSTNTVNYSEGQHGEGYVGTYVRLGGIWYKSKYNLKKLRENGDIIAHVNVYPYGKEKYLGKVFPANIKPWVDFSTP